MSPRQLGSSHWTSAVYTETAGEVPSEQSPPPAAARTQSGVVNMVPHCASWKLELSACLKDGRL